MVQIKIIIIVQICLLCINKENLYECISCMCVYIYIYLYICNYVSTQTYMPCILHTEYISSYPILKRVYSKLPQH